MREKEGGGGGGGSDCHEPRSDETNNLDEVRRQRREILPGLGIEPAPLATPNLRRNSEDSIVRLGNSAI